VARLAGRAGSAHGPRAGARRPRPRDPAAAGRRAGPVRTLLLQGARAHPRRHPRNRSATVGRRPGRHGLARRPHRARLAPRGPVGRGPRGQAAVRQSGPVPRHRGRRHRGGARAADPGGRRPAPAGPGCRL
jgi:hypothetical protein